MATSGGYVYWADEATEKIARAKLNGSGGVSEVESHFIGGAHSPYGVAVGGGYVYWANHATDTIGRAKLDGGEVKQDFITGAHGPEGVALDGRYVYWANNRDGTIARAKLDGGEVEQRFITGQSHPEWVAVGGPPAAASAPAISGTAQQDRQLTESHATWLNGATRYEYQWERCDSGGWHCGSIGGATHQSYTLTEQDVGHTLRVRESASNGDGTGEPATSVATAGVLPLAPANLSPPAVSGTTTQGQTLTATHGSWSHGASSYSYEWEDCDSSGGDCTASATSGWETYALTLADAGGTIRVKVWASNAGGTSAAAVSAPTQVVLPLPPVDSVPPSIAGALTVGQTLTEGATSSTYAVTLFPVSDGGETLQVAVTATNAFGEGTAESTDGTAVPVPTPAPRPISGGGGSLPI